MALSPLQPPEDGEGPQGPPARQPPVHLSRVPTDPNPCTTSVPLGYFWGAREPQTLKCPPPKTPCRQTSRSAWVALYDVTKGTEMGLGGPT